MASPSLTKSPQKRVVNRHPQIARDFPRGIHNLKSARAGCFPFMAALVKILGFPASKSPARNVMPLSKRSWHNRETYPKKYTTFSHMMSVADIADKLRNKGASLFSSPAWSLQVFRLQTSGFPRHAQAILMSRPATKELSRYLSGWCQVQSPKEHWDLWEIPSWVDRKGSLAIL